MAQENLSSKILPSNNFEPTIHPFYPSNKVTYLDQSVESVVPCKIYPESSDISNGAPIEFVIHECSEFYIDLSSIKLEVTLRILDAAGGRHGVADDAKSILQTTCYQLYSPWSRSLLITPMWRASTMPTI